MKLAPFFLTAKTKFAVRYIMHMYLSSSSSIIKQFISKRLSESQASFTQPLTFTCTYIVALEIIGTELSQSVNPILP